MLNFGDGLQLCNTVEDALSHSSCQLVWNESLTDSSRPTPLSPTSSISPAYTTTPTLYPSSSLPPATTTSTLMMMEDTSLPVSVPSSSLSAAPYHTRSTVPLPTASTGLIILMRSGDSSGPEEPPLVILNDHSQVRLPTAAIYSTVSDEQQGPGSIPHGETIMLSEESSDANSSALLDHKCLVSLNWPAAA